jgi:predicted molibdopterin-dependent oxidoreductase YjgC
MAERAADGPAARHEPAVVVSVDGRQVSTLAGETVAAVLVAEGVRVFRHTAKWGEPRGIFCGMGICYECLVTVDGVQNVRACVTIVRPGMAIQLGLAEPQHD